MNASKPVAKRATSAPPVKRNVFATQSQLGVTPKSSSGAADEQMFMNAFEDVPQVILYSSKDLELELNKFVEICSDASIIWEKRNDSLKRFRSLLIAGAADFDEFTCYLKPLELPFQVSVKDLRSQVVREACITIAYLSQRIGLRCDRFCEALLPTLINLIQNSAKIMSSSAIVTIRFIIQHTRASRLIPIITYNISSKSKEIRKACCEFLVQLLHTWPTHAIERHVAILQEAIKKGISDADSEARAYSRKAFWGFADKFKLEADYLLNSLDSSKQRLIHGEQYNISVWSSTNSLNKAGNTQSLRPQSLRTNSIPSIGSTENIVRQSGDSLSAKPRSGIPTFSPRNELASSSSTRMAIPASPMRATSAIDPGAQRRAKARAAIAIAAAMNVKANAIPPTGYSLPRTNVNKKMDSLSSPERSRTKARVSKSQPGSRSASPSSRLYYTSMQNDNRSHRVRRKSGIPLSTSRETSPNRSVITGYASMERRLSNGSKNRYTGISSNERQTPLMAEKILLQSQEAEAALEDALTTNTNVSNARKRYNSYDDHSDESETSSICSDISFGSFGGRKIEDVSDIIHNLSSAHWSDRKEGLLSLAIFLRHSSRTLNPYELKRITDIFTKMLLDPHTKTFTLFLGILNDLIVSYKSDLNSWLYILMTRLFLKIGSDTLGSIQNKILKTFDLIRESFSPEDQFNVIIRFLSDQTQTPNVKVKTAVLQYLINLIPLMDSNDFSYNSRHYHEIQLSLMKIISWTADPKSSELRKISQDVIVDLNSLNCSDMTIIINALPKTYQDAALQIIQHKRRTRSQSPSISPLAPSLIKTTAAALSKLSFYDETENLNPDDIYNSLKQTTDEIQKFSLNIETESMSLNSSSNNYNNPNVQSTLSSKKKVILGHSFNASQDSGISQVDGVFINNNSTAFNNSALKQNLSEKMNSSQNGFNNYDNNTSVDCFNTVINNLRINFKDHESQKDAFNDLIELIREGTNDEWIKHFKDVYRILLQKMIEDANSAIRALSLRVMCELLMKQTKYFQDYIELTILRILEASKDSEKEVIRASESAAATAATVLPPEQCLKILKSVIKTGESPMNIAAIKMLTKLIELQPKQIVMNLLPEMMPALLQAYDNSESAVRKAAVFCMVSIHGVVGETMNSYLSSLSGSKMKLLRLYIERAKSHSGCSSPTLTNNS